MMQREREREREREKEREIERLREQLIKKSIDTCTDIILEAIYLISSFSLEIFTSYRSSKYAQIETCSLVCQIKFLVFI